MKHLPASLSDLQTQALERSAKLYAAVIAKIVSGDFDPSQLLTLAHAAYLFVRGDLGEVTSRATLTTRPGRTPIAPAVPMGPNVRKTGKVLTDFLSQPLPETRLSGETQGYLRNLGIEYVGELAGLELSRSDSYLGHGRFFLRKEGVDPGLDPAAIGWDPPYLAADDQSLISFLHRPVEEALLRYPAELGGADFYVWYFRNQLGIQRVGDLLNVNLRARSRQGQGSNDWFHLLRRALRPGLPIRAGMVIPGWEKLPEVGPRPDPPLWTEAQRAAFPDVRLEYQKNGGSLIVLGLTVTRGEETVLDISVSTHAPDLLAILSRLRDHPERLVSSREIRNGSSILGAAWAYIPKKVRATFLFRATGLYGPYLIAPVRNVTLAERLP